MDIQFKDSEKTPVIGNKRTCDICKKSQASYTCPRCNIQYCSLECYRDPVEHLKCSEDFFQNEVITELKLCKLDDKKCQSKIIEILKKESQMHEKEQILPGDLTEESESEDESEPVNLDEDKLIKAYRDEINKWSPWWIKYKESLIKELNQHDFEFKLNSNLMKKSTKVNVENASSMLFDDIICLFYTYSIFAYIYQLEEDNTYTDLDINNNLSEEVAVNFLKVDKLLNAKVLKDKSTNLSSRIELSIKVLIEDKTIFLKDYLNEKFLTDLVKEMIFMNESPATLRNFLSILYDFFEKYSKTKTTQAETMDNIRQATEEFDEKPINVFHHNKENRDKAKQVEGIKKSRIKILSPAQSREKTLNAQEDTPKTNDTSKEIKLFLKRLEFYFKWLNFKLADLKSVSRIAQISDELNTLLTKLSGELEQIDTDNHLMDRNIDWLRKNNQNNNEKTLIEEI